MSGSVGYGDRESIIGRDSYRKDDGEEEEEHVEDESTDIGGDMDIVIPVVFKDKK